VGKETIVVVVVVVVIVASLHMVKFTPQ